MANKQLVTIWLKHLTTNTFPPVIFFEQEIAKASELGNQVKQLVNRGWYVPDDLTNLIVKNKILDLETNHQHFILDGCPRTLEQAHNFSIN